MVKLQMRPAQNWHLMHERRSMILESHLILFEGLSYGVKPAIACLSLFTDGPGRNEMVTPVDSGNRG